MPLVSARVDTPAALTDGVFTALPFQAANEKPRNGNFSQSLVASCWVLCLVTGTSVARHRPDIASLDANAQ